MHWNYTKSWACLSVAVLALGILGNIWGRIDAVIFMLPVCIIADFVSWRRHRITVLPPE